MVTTEQERPRNQMTELVNTEFASQVVDRVGAIPAASGCIKQQFSMQTVLLEQRHYRMQKIVLEGGTTFDGTSLSNSH